MENVNNSGNVSHSYHPYYTYSAAFLDSYNALCSASDVLSLVTFAVELPAICLAVYALLRLVKKDQNAPVFVMNLLVSDLLQVIARPGYYDSGTVMSTEIFISSILLLIFQIEVKIPISDWTAPLFSVVGFLGITASVGFMVCISLERYLLVAHPVWYRYRQTVTYSVLISVGVWLFALTFLAVQFVLVQDSLYSRQDNKKCGMFCLPQSVPFLLPFPFLIFFFVGTWRALSRCVSVSRANKMRILGILLLVLGNYTLLFLPNIVVLVFYQAFSTDLSYYPSQQTLEIFKKLDVIALMLLHFGPLVDTLLYIFIRKDAKDTLEAFPCCRRLISNQVDRGSIPTVSQTVVSV